MVTSPDSAPLAPVPLSVFVIALNEADRIRPTLDAARRLTDDVIVVDSGSTDATRTIAAECGARVVDHAFEGYGPQKRFAEDLARNPWLLNIDADEVMPPDLVAEIAALFADGEPPYAAYRIRIAEIFPGERAPHRFAYALSPVRLYRRDAGRYSASPVHDRVELLPGTVVGRLRGTIHHFSVRSLGDQLDKLNGYSERQADDLDARGERLTALRLFVEFPAAFLKAYIGRRHALRGLYGFLTAMNFAFYRYLRVAKHFERRLKRAGTPPDAG